MIKVKVKEYQKYRDGGTTEYIDEYNRLYIVRAPIYDDDSIYNQVPWTGIDNETKERIRIKGIELEVVESF